MPKVFKARTIRAGGEQRKLCGKGSVLGTFRRILQRWLIVLIANYCTVKQRPRLIFQTRLYQLLL
ncbi:hypothetical protein TU84_02955 [Pseudomonas helleri]|nr:hypothetical protein TU84_02955 [Pseudomonas helleri]